MRETTCFPADSTHLLEGEGTPGYIFWSNSALSSATPETRWFHCLFRHTCRDTCSKLLGSISLGGKLSQFYGLSVLEKMVENSLYGKCVSYRVSWPVAVTMDSVAAESRVYRERADQKTLSGKVVLVDRHSFTGFWKMWALLDYSLI